MKVTLNLKRFIAHAELQNKKNQLSSMKASNERYDEADKQSRQKMYEKLSLKTRENYESKLKNVGSEVETFCKDLNNMMVGIEEK